MMPQEFTDQIPLWVVVSLGKPVLLKTDFLGACETYSKGCQGILMGIETCQGNYGGRLYALVALDRNDPGYLENFLFDEIEPVADKIKYSLDVQRGVIAF